MEPALDRETVDGIIIKKLMDIDFELDLLVEHFGLGDDEDEEDDDDA